MPDCPTQEIPSCPLRIGELRLSQGWMAGYGRSFRGSITDYTRTITLGSGYLGSWADTNVCRNCRAKGIDKCRHFEIDTARHLIGPFKAIQDPNVRIVMLLKAAQTAGSLVWDLAVHFLLTHSGYMRIKVLMDSDPKATVYCQQRLMETLKNNPDISPLLPSGAERFAVTDTELRLLNGKTLFVGGLNDRNASSLPADVMILDEGWLHQSDGLLEKAFARTKQTKNKKIIIVGQAGNVKEDQDQIWNNLHARIPLTWACPCCGGRQQFELHKKRPADFKPVLVTENRIGKLPLPISPPQPGTYAGFKVPKRFSELNSPEEIKAACAATTIECFYCGFEIPDTKEMRQALNASYQQEYQLLAADGSRYTPEDYSVGFWQPDPASMTVPFAQTMEAYVAAIKAKEQFDNRVPIRDFYLSRWAQPWDDALENKKHAFNLLPGSYETDPNKRSFGEDFHCRQMTVDCGKALDAETGDKRIGTFWFEVRDWSKRGHSLQLARGFVDSWELLAAQGRFWKVPNARTFIDSAWMPSQVEEAAVRFFELEKISDVMSIPRCWRLMLGAGAGRRLTVGNKGVAFLENKLPNVRSAHDKTGKLWRMSLYKLTWSNLWFEQQFESIIGGGVDVKWEILPREKVLIVDMDGQPSEKLTAQSLEREEGNGKKFPSYEDQLDSRYYSDAKRQYLDYEKQSRPTEFRDCALMQLVGVAADGLLGHVGQQQQELQER